jgi:nifR3 family TIM-barrel protein
LLDDLGFDAIDLNMGCPVRKIVGSGSGAALLKDVDRLRRTVEAARAVTRRPLSVKIRLGFSPDTINVEETATLIAQAGADQITIHGRTREDSYAVPVQRAGIARGLRAAALHRPTMVTVGNGDILDAASAHAMVRETGCRAVMVSRGAMGNPWIFEEILGRRVRPPQLGEWCELVLRHLDYHEAFYGDNELSARLTRKHLIWYASGFPHSHRLREQMNHVTSLAAARAIIQHYQRDYPADLRRFEDTATARRTHDHDPKHEMDRQMDRGVGEEGLPS